MEEKEINEKKDKLAKLFSDKYTLIFLGILIFSIILLLYYFNLTKDQTLWWDEAEYMSMAKSWAFNISYDLNPQRPFLFPFLAFLLYKIGFSEIGLRIFLELIPLLSIIVLTFLLVKEMYDVRVALIASFITSVSWIHLFYAMRLMTDMIGLLFGLLSFYCFWKGYVNKKGKWYIWLIGFFVSLSTMIRLTGVLYGLVILAFLILTDKFKFIKNKDMWISLGVSILSFLPLMIYDFFVFGNALAFKSGYSGAPNTPLGWNFISEVYNYPEFGFFIFFIIGFILSLEFLLFLNELIKKPEKRYFGDLFMVLNLIFILGFFIYFLRTGENRWLIAMALSIFVLSAKGIVFIYDLFKKNFKTLALLGVIIMIIFGAYYEIKHADSIIKVKVPSYKEVKESGLWIKGNSQKTDSILTMSVPQMSYYSERKVYNYGGLNSSQVQDMITQEKPAFFTFSPVYETHMLNQELIPWIQENSKNENSLFIPVNVVFFNQDKNQLAYITFKINYK